MAVVMSMRWRGLSPDQYEQVRSLANWEGDRPEGGNFHVAGFDGDTLRIVDIWESPEHFQRFAEEKLRPAMETTGVGGSAQPEPQFFPIETLAKGPFVAETVPVSVEQNYVVVEL